MHGPGCPVCVTAARDDRPRARDRRAARRHLHLVRRHAARARLARRPARRCAAAAPTSASSTRRSTRSRIARANPDRRGRLLRHRLRDHRAGQRDGADRRRSAHGVANFSMLVSHVLVPPAIASHPAGAATTACRRSSGPGTSARSSGFREYEALAARYRVPIVITGFEPVDLLEGVLAGGAPARGGPRRRREPVRAHGRAATATRGARARSTRCSRSSTASGAASARSRSRATGSAASTARTTPSASSRSTTIDDARARGLHQRPGPARAEEAVRLPRVRHARARRATPLGATMVSAEGACAAYYQYGRPHRARRRDDGVTAAIVAQGARERGARRRASSTEHAAQLERARGALAERLRRGRPAFVMGNGGSACDAQHVAVEFLHPIIEKRRALPAHARWPPTPRCSPRSATTATSRRCSSTQLELLARAERRRARHLDLGHVGERHPRAAPRARARAAARSASPGATAARWPTLRPRVRRAELVDPPHPGGPHLLLHLLWDQVHVALGEHDVL